MLQVYASPAFQGRARPDSYYREINGIIATLRRTASLAVISDHLNKSGFLTPRGLPFDRQRLANYLRNTSI